MEILLIDPSWHARFLEQSEDFNLSDESVKELAENRGQKSASKIEDNIAITSILGPLTKNKDFFFSLFGGVNTTYNEIIDSVNGGENDNSVTGHKLVIDSPGGEWGGLTEAVQALSSAKKTITVEVVGMATSAAFILASQGDKIVSSNSGNEIGGLGVQTRVFDDSKFAKMVRSSNAPNKNPDAFTVKGEKELVKQLDAIEEKAIKMVSEGRSAATGENITEKVIKKDFGRGASMLADEALSRNMIDEVTPPPERISNSIPAATSGKGRKLGLNGSNIKPEIGKIMDLATLRSEHPEFCAQLVEEGRLEVWKQVKGHVTMAKTTGAMDFALECLEGKKNVQDPDVFAGYASAQLKNVDLKNRTEDNPDGDLANDGDTELSEQQKEDSLVDQVMGMSNKPATAEV